MVEQPAVNRLVAGSTPAFTASFNTWVCSSIGRAPALHAGGCRFDACQIHQDICPRPDFDSGRVIQGQSNADPNAAGPSVVRCHRVSAGDRETHSMPYAPLKPCSFAGGCPELVAKGMCEKHQKQISAGYNQARGSASKNGYDRDWEKVRLRALDRDGYLCQHCLKYDDRLVPAKHVDHIKPFHGKNDPLRLALSNLQSLCQPCHSRKTAKEDGGLGHTRKATN